jgi:hypothetical protein
LGSDNKLVIITLFVTKEKEKMTTHLCHLLLHFKHKQKDERRKGKKKP